MSTDTVTSECEFINDHHRRLPSGRIALWMALVDQGHELSPLHQAEVDAWKGMIGPKRICAYDPDSREGWWIVPLKRGESGWFRFPAS